MTFRVVKRRTTRKLLLQLRDGFAVGQYRDGPTQWMDEGAVVVDARFTGITSREPFPWRSPGASGSTHCNRGTARANGQCGAGQDCVRKAAGPAGGARVALGQGNQAVSSNSGRSSPSPATARAGLGRANRPAYLRAARQGVPA
jgi:hypothetical protein